MNIDTIKKHVMNILTKKYRDDKFRHIDILKIKTTGDYYRILGIYYYITKNSSVFYYSYFIIKYNKKFNFFHDFQIEYPYATWFTSGNKKIKSNCVFFLANKSDYEYQRFLLMT